MSEIETLTICQIKKYINSLISENQSIYNDNAWKDYYIYEIFKENMDLKVYIQQLNTKIQNLEEFAKNQKKETEHLNKKINPLQTENDFLIEENAILKSKIQKVENDYNSKLERYISSIYNSLI